MVNFIFSLLIIVGGVFLPLVAQDVKVTSSVEGYTFRSQQAISGTISITHESSQKVDLKSFRLGGVPIEVTPVQETQISPVHHLVVSFYKFTLPGKEKGLYVLPRVSVKVGGDTYESVENTYEVLNAAPGSAPTPAAATSIYAPAAPLPCDLSRRADSVVLPLYLQH
jgi:hypothetical protein